MIAAVTSATSQSTRFDPAALARLLDGRYVEVREQVREVLSRPDFTPPVAMPTAEYRELVLGWARKLVAEGLTAPGFPSQFGRTRATTPSRYSGRCRTTASRPPTRTSSA